MTLSILWQSETEDLALWQSHMEEEAISGLDQVLHKLPLRTMEHKEHDSGSDSHGSFSVRTKMAQTRRWTLPTPSLKIQAASLMTRMTMRMPSGITEEGSEILTKGQRRRLLNAAQQIADAAVLEVSSRSATMAKTPKAGLLHWHPIATSPMDACSDLVLVSAVLKPLRVSHGPCDPKRPHRELV